MFLPESNKESLRRYSTPSGKKYAHGWWHYENSVENFGNFLLIPYIAIRRKNFTKFRSSNFHIVKNTYKSSCAYFPIQTPSATTYVLILPLTPLQRNRPVTNVSTTKPQYYSSLHDGILLVVHLLQRLNHVFGIAKAQETKAWNNTKNAQT